MTKGGADIESVPLKDSINPGISYSMQYAGYDACVACGLDLWRWENGLYPKQFMAKTIAFYQLRAAVRNHTEAAGRKKK